MHLIPIPQRHFDFAWKDGASALGESCVEECTPDQLKLLISRGERQLVRMDSDGETVGWAAFRIDAMPNFNAFFVTNMTAHNARFETFYGLLTDMAKDLGCSRIRFAAKPAQRRLYKMKLKATDVYTILEKEVL
jgi:hypothetical protein